MHFDTQTLIGVGVGIHLLAALAKTLFHSPRQQAQISAIESKVDEILGQVTQATKGDAK